MKCTSPQLRNMLFLDIETVPRYASYAELSDNWKNLWQAKHNTFRDIQETEEESYASRAGIYAEFGKVICVSVGYFHRVKALETDMFRVKSFSGEQDKGWMTSILANVGWIGVFFFLWWLFVVRQMQSGGRQAMSFGKTRAKNQTNNK